MVSGKISLTCDAWQASNVDAYFTVTAHWVEENSPNKWELNCAVVGFVQLNSTHSGVRLGQALFKIVKRVGIESKVCILYSRNLQMATTLLSYTTGIQSHL